MTLLTASAPGKVILHGEYAVVFAKKAIAVAIDLRTRVKLSLGEASQSVHLSLRDLGFSHVWPLQSLQSTGFTDDGGNTLPALQLEKLEPLAPDIPDSATAQAVKAFLYLYIGIARRHASWPAVSVDVESEFPSGAGLGSSAAYSVSLAAALMKGISGVEATRQVVSEWAFRCEHIFHGKPSGIDNSICSYGGAILFQAGDITQEMRDVKSLRALLVYTNVTRNTKRLVEQVSRRRERLPGVISSIMEAIDELSNRSWQLIQSGDYVGEARRELVTINQCLLNALGAGHESIERVLAIASGCGFEGKLTGAGGGGCVIIHLPSGLFHRRMQFTLMHSH